MKTRLVARAHPMNLVDPVEGAELVDALDGLDGASWAAVWGAAGDRARADAERATDPAQAEALFMRAHGLYFMGRFPCPNHPAKQRCAELERSTYVAAAQHWASPVERVAVPFDGRDGEGHEVVCLVRRPANVVRPRVVVMWGGADGRAAAVGDRCPHRFAPLHLGRVSGNSIMCSYHGLAFDGTGRCTSNPHGDGKIRAPRRCSHTRSSSGTTH